MKKENNELETNDEKYYTSKPNLGFIIGLNCAILAIVQGLCSLINIDLPINILIDIASLVLTVLVSLKIIKSDKTGSVQEISHSIKQDLMDGLDNTKKSPELEISSKVTKQSIKAKSSQMANKDSKIIEKESIKSNTKKNSEEDVKSKSKTRKAKGKEVIDEEKSTSEEKSKEEEITK